VVLFIVGDINSGGKKLTAGEIINETDLVKTGKKSTCDLQIRESDAEIIIRLKPETEFQLKSKSVGNGKKMQALVRAGSGMFNVSKKLKQEEIFEALSPTSLAGVRGTKFEMNVSSDGSSVVNVIEGKVASRPRLSQVEDLPESLVQKSEMLSNVVSSLESNEQIMEKGQFVSIKKSDTDKMIKETGVSEVIAKANLEIKNGMSNAEIQKEIEKIEKSVEESEKKESLKKKIEFKNQVKIEKIKDQELARKIKEYEELIAVEKKKLEDSRKVNDVIKERNIKEKEILMKRIEQIVGKSSETLILKNGIKIQGVIFQEGSTYIVLTPHGKETYPEDQVEGLEL
ncbi:MAG: FecR domain-containing protein, partial [Leptospira sp.]|nr:FecR domain-containing protein [Leptospira sp.]